MNSERGRGWWLGGCADPWRTRVETGVPSDGLVWFPPVTNTASPDVPQRLAGLCKVPQLAMGRARSHLSFLFAQGHVPLPGPAVIQCPCPVQHPSRCLCWFFLHLLCFPLLIFSCFFLLPSLPSWTFFFLSLSPLFSTFLLLQHPLPLPPPSCPSFLSFTKCWLTA